MMAALALLGVLTSQVLLVTGCSLALSWCARRTLR